MITEQEIINDLEKLSKKLDFLSKNRRNNQEFWRDIKNKVDKINKIIKEDKKIYGW